MADIFISYKKEESEFAKQFARAFEAEGWTVWWDAQIQAGDDFDETIREELEKARIVVVLWSQQSVESDYIKGEARSSKDQGKLISVFIDDVAEAELPFDLQAIQGERIQDPADKAGLQKLLNDITARIGPAKSKRERELEEKLNAALTALNEQQQGSKKMQVREFFPWALAFILAVLVANQFLFSSDSDETAEELRAELAASKEAFAREEEKNKYDRAQIDVLKNKVATLEALEQQNAQLEEEVNRWQTSADEAEQKNREDARIIQELTEKASEVNDLRTANEELAAEVDKWKSGVYTMTSENQADVVSADTLARKEAELEDAIQANSVLTSEMKELRTVAEQSAAQIESDRQTIKRLQAQVAETDDLRKASDELMIELDKWKSGVYTSDAVNERELVSVETLKRKEAELAELQTANSALQLEADKLRSRTETTMNSNQALRQELVRLESQIAQVNALQAANTQLESELNKWRSGEFQVSGEADAAEQAALARLRQTEAELADVRRISAEQKAQIEELRTSAENAIAQNESDSRTIAALEARVVTLQEELDAAQVTPVAPQHALIGVWQGKAVVGPNQPMAARLEIGRYEAGVLTGRITITGGTNSCSGARAKLTPQSRTTYGVTFSGGCNARGELKHQDDALNGNVAFSFTNDRARVRLNRIE